MDNTYTFILIASAIWFIISLIAAIGGGKFLKAGHGPDEAELAGALEGSLEPYVRDLNREAGK